MIIISISYEDKWVFKKHPKYIMTKCKKVINIKRGVVIKKTIKNGVIGWWISSEFIPQKKINENVELIKKEKIPF